ncbi:hypothetical protein SBA3_1680016 [Candidatus Sulfopaludibacter sp. SbA3]|nr:hypothetical protein SBA3_1680016 [Candidatus Sulfopaludibacter sp. SbA3]
MMAAYQAATGAPPTYAQFTAALTSIRAGTQTPGNLFASLINGSSRRPTWTRVCSTVQPRQVKSRVLIRLDCRDSSRP